MNGSEHFEQIKRIRGRLQEKLDPMRYEHSLSVSFTCVCLAMRWGCDIRRAELAGILHDCAKQYSGTELCEKCRDAGIELTEAELRAPQVIHARYGAYMARKRFGVEDEEVLSAIACHTLGKPAMSTLEAILFVADYIEARRDKADCLPQLRQLAFVNLNRCVYEIMRQTFDYLKRKGAYICEESFAACEYYKRYGSNSSAM